jgi:L-seryl-tRNA(Ser) seleniumtransferase
MDDQKKMLLKELPKIDELMLLLEQKDIFAKAPRDIVKSVCRMVVADLRQSILDKKNKALHAPATESMMEHAIKRVEVQVNGLSTYRFHRVINATGIILHTNLGRAPLCPEAVARLHEVAGNYANLEFNLETGKRGLRYDHVQRILCALSGAEDALVVNNNAAAVLLVLNSLAEGKEAIVSRGELVEIGGEFRIPEVMEKSGAHLREVGSTNRTRLADYEKAIHDGTGVILKVHTSNFRIVGFTEETGLEALVTLGSKYGVPVVNDLGSGCFIELDRYGLEKETTVREVLATGVDVVTFSGDKLLGGPQAGIILGKEKILEKIKKNPLNRALRIDKLTLAALEATMIQYLQPEKAMNNIRVLKSLTEPLPFVMRRAKKLFAMLKRAHMKGLSLAVRKGASLAGGGALPTCNIPTALIPLRSENISAAGLEARLRKLEIPIIARIADDEVLFDLRTIAEEELAMIVSGVKSVIDEDYK